MKHSKNSADDTRHHKLSSKIDRELITITTAERRTLDLVARGVESEIVESRDAFEACIDKKYIDIDENKYFLTEIGRKARSSQVQ